MDDRALSSWLLIVGSVAIGWWYWHLTGAQKTALFGHSPMQVLTMGSPSAGGLAVAPITGPNGSPNYGPPQFNPGTSGGHAGIGP
jgi:hypothetical protein